MDTGLAAPQRQSLVGDRQSVLGCPRDLKQSPWMPPPRAHPQPQRPEEDTPRRPQRRRDAHTAPCTRHALPASAVSVSRSSGDSCSPAALWGPRIQMVVPPQSPRLGEEPPPQAPPPSTSQPLTSTPREGSQPSASLSP